MAKKIGAKSTKSKLNTAGTRSHGKRARSAHWIYIYLYYIQKQLKIFKNTYKHIYIYTPTRQANLCNFLKNTTRWLRRVSASILYALASLTAVYAVVRVCPNTAGSRTVCKCVCAYKKIYCYKSARQPSDSQWQRISQSDIQPSNQAGSEPSNKTTTRQRISARLTGNVYKTYKVFTCACVCVCVWARSFSQ